MPDAPRHEGTIAMVTGRYPGISFTFIDREVRALREMGVDALTFQAFKLPVCNAAMQTSTLVVMYIVMLATVLQAPCKSPT